MHDDTGWASETRAVADGDAILLAQHACLVAAKAWSDRATTREDALARLLRALAFAERAVRGPVAENPRAFLDVLRKPLTDTLGPTAASVTLLHGDHYSDDAQALEDELGSDPVAERVERRILRAMDAFGAREDGAELYRSFRRFVVENPIAHQADVARILRGTDLAVSELYEPVPPSRYLQLYVRREERDERFVFRCPRCGYPMRIQADTVRCTAERCQDAGAQYLLDAGKLRSLGGAPDVKPETIRHEVVLREPFWRYVLIPGLTELDLQRALEELGATVTLWPNLDAFDLLVEAPGLRLRLDVKDWRSPSALVAHLRRRSAPGNGITYVLPDAQEDALPRFRRGLPGVEVLVFRQVIHAVREGLRG